MSSRKRVQQRVNLNKPLYCKNCFLNRKGFVEVTKIVRVVNEHLHIVTGFECFKCGKTGYNGIVKFETIVQYKKASEAWAKRIEEFMEEVYEYEHPKSSRYSI